MNKPRILLFVGYYFPGYKAGGPLRTISNMVDLLGDEFEFLIITRDRDLCDTVPYANLILDEWVEHNNTKVLYVSLHNTTIKYFLRVIKNTDFNVLYLNSFFDSKFSIWPLIARRLCFTKRCPVVLAPRGEFSAGALALKPVKKRFFILFARWLGLHRDVVWQASSEFEKSDIISALGVDPANVWIAKDLPSKGVVRTSSKKENSGSSLKLVFLSRISPIKNLDFALKVLIGVKCSVVFDIYGPIEDQAYWSVCQEIISRLPTNIQVKYCGSVNPDQVGEIFADYDLFFFPTKGENYGHVIAESLAVGTPVLISDQSPWRALGDDKLGWDLSLNNDALFVQKIESLSRMGHVERCAWRKQVAEVAVTRIHSQDDVNDNRALFKYSVTLQSN